MTVLFTICSNNYLAQARVLMDSVKKYNPDYKRIIGLVDQFSDQIDYSVFEDIEIIPVEELAISRWEEMLNEYDIIELNTSVKPSYFKFLQEKHSDAEKIFYFDPDIKLFSSLEELAIILDTNSIVLTPHIVTPIDLDALLPEEQTFLNRGIYNLGFIGLRSRDEESLRFLTWWEQRCIHRCKRDICNGLFVDQLWISLVHILFNNTFILRNYGYNMAPWNLHERAIVDNTADGYILNDGSILTFYHFSSYDYREPEQLNRPFYNRFTFESRTDLHPLYNEYQEELISNNIAALSTIGCSLYLNNSRTKSKESETRKSHSTILKSTAKKLLPPLIFDAYRNIKARMHFD